MQPSDEELYLQMRKGNQDAFAQLYEGASRGSTGSLAHLRPAPRSSKKWANASWVAFPHLQVEFLVARCITRRSLSIDFTTAESSRNHSCTSFVGQGSGP